MAFKSGVGLGRGESAAHVGEPAGANRVGEKTVASLPTSTQMPPPDPALVQDIARICEQVAKEV
jgi:hypothetical protein